MNDRQGGAGLFTGGLGGAGQLSPYLNIDPSYLSNSQPEYLYDTEAKRGNFEKSFTSIGSSVCLGSASGGVYGIYAGLRETAKADLTTKLRRTQVINHIQKKSSLVGNALGSIAVSYCATHCLLGWTETLEREEEAKSVIAGTLTGLLFKSSAGSPLKCLKGGLVGLAISTVWAFGLRKQESVQHYI